MKLQRYVLTVVLVLFSQAASVGAKTQSVSRIVTAIIDGVSYCRDDNELYSARLKIHFRYSNNTGSDMVARKVPDVVADRVARTVRDLKKGRLERHFVAHRMIAVAPVDPGPTVESESEQGKPEYDVLSAHASYSTEDIVYPILVRIERSSNIPSSITSGTHVLQLELSNQASHPNARRKANSISDHSVEILKTQPVVFTIGEPAEMNSCFE